MPNFASIAWDLETRLGNKMASVPQVENLSEEKHRGIPEATFLVRKKHT